MLFTERYIPHFIIASGTIVAVSMLIFGGAFPAIAKESTIVFPVAELGNCKNKEACHSYCNEPTNITACIEFAETNGLMGKKEAEVARKFSNTLSQQDGPGGCRDQVSCMSYCENINNLQECIAFAEDNDHSDPDIEEGKKIARYLDGGGQMPGGCTSRQSCEAYCSDFNNMQECISFAEGAGLQMREPDGQEISIDQVKKIHGMMSRGETPGGCTSRDQCESFCENPDNAEQCLNFAASAGLMPPEQIERARKMMSTGGPGGCRGRVECESFCSNPKNLQTCMSFAQDNDMMRPEDAQRMNEMRSAFNDGVQKNAPPGIGNCVRDKIVKATVSGGRPDQTVMRSVMQECMEQIGPDGFGEHPPNEGEFPPGEQPFGPLGEEGPGQFNRPPLDNSAEGKFGPPPFDDYRGERFGPTQDDSEHFGPPGEFGRPGEGFIPPEGIPPEFIENADFLPEGGLPQDIDPASIQEFIDASGIIVPADANTEAPGEFEAEFQQQFEGSDIPEEVFNTEFQAQVESEFQQQIEEQYQNQYEQQYQDQYQQQYEQQYQEQYQQQVQEVTEQFIDGGGTIQQPIEDTNFAPPPADQFTPPPSFSPPPADSPPPPPPPTSMRLNNMLANVILAIFSLYGAR